MNRPSDEWREAVRDANWQLLKRLADTAHPPVVTDAEQLSELIELNAPTDVLLRCVAAYSRLPGADVHNCGLLEACAALSHTHSYAFLSFRTLLTAGLSPNIIIFDGNTLLQSLISRNRVREVTELLRHGVDPQQMNAYGREGTSNREGARRAGNAAGELAWAWFQRKGSMQ
jgi:hypothetical protein